jgi:UPF0176 protein
MNLILNISAYKFVALGDLAELRESVRAQALACGLKGTVLLAEEGINIFVAGAAAPARRFISWLRRDARLADMVVKESRSDHVPFGKLLIKVKLEIIRMNRPAIRPQVGRAPAVGAATLARWLDRGSDDAGRPVVMLDTRNGFEVDRGRFTGAMDWRLAKFSDFPQALLMHCDQLRGKTVVSYCTGGIRCEKAALFMRDAGVDPVYQLEGGILKYLEETAGTHFEGECFVFDARGALDRSLQAAQTV